MGVEIGVTPLTIINYEKDQSTIPESKLYLIRKVFGIQQHKLIDGDYFEKDNVKIDIHELAVFFVENQELFLKEKILRLVIKKIVAEELREVLRDIIAKQNLEK